MLAYVSDGKCIARRLRQPLASLSLALQACLGIPKLSLHVDALRNTKTLVEHQRSSTLKLLLVRDTGVGKACTTTLSYVLVFSVVMLSLKDLL